MEPGEVNGHIDYTESEPGGNGPWDGPNDPIGMLESIYRNEPHPEQYTPVVWTSTDTKVTIITFIIFVIMMIGIIMLAVHCEPKGV